MKTIIYFLYTILLITPFFSRDLMAQNDNKEVCLSKDEIELYNLIMDYRKSKKLPAIPLSKSLSIVAQSHAKDLDENKPYNESCNPHSWSDRGVWKACCYDSEHRNKECMWDKPKELTEYSGSGYEIVYYHSNAAKPLEALNAWKKSKGHNMVMVNLDIWKKASWNAVGIGIYKNHATVWFGVEPDPAGKVSQCTQGKSEL